MTCGIYMIKRKDTGQMYIGQSVNIERRWNEHVSKGKNKSYIDKAINKHGQDNFILTIIEEVSKKQLNDREQYWIKYYNTYSDVNHYNLSPGGDINPMDNIESRKRVSEALSNKVRTREHALSLANAHNSTGFLHVTKEKNNAFKQGFRWVYRCKSNGKIITLTSTSIERLKEKVLYRGFEWKILDKNLADKSLKEEKNILSNKKNTSGYYRVSKHKCSGCKQGFIWAYEYKEANKRKIIKRVDIDDLKTEVEKRSLIWEEF